MDFFKGHYSIHHRDQNIMGPKFQMERKTVSYFFKPHIIVSCTDIFTNTLITFKEIIAYNSSFSLGRSI